MGISRTIDPVSDRKELKRRILILARYLAFNLTKLALTPKLISLSIRYDFGAKSKAHRRTNRLFSEKLLIQAAEELFDECDIFPHCAVTRIALRTGDFYRPLTADILEYEKDRKFAKLLKGCQALRQKYGINEIRWGVELM
jgi:DNA polymerase-4